MTERDVSALILVSATHEIGDLARTLEMVRAQSAPPSCVVAAVPESAPKELRNFAESVLDEGRIDLLRVTPAGASRPDIVEDLVGSLEEAKRARDARSEHKSSRASEAQDGASSPDATRLETSEAAGEKESAPRNFTLLNPAFGGAVRHEDEGPTLAEEPS